MKKSILEHVADGKEIATFHATDPDISDNARFLYSLNDPSGAFEINPHTGSLTMKDGAKFDREKFKNGFVDLVIGTLELKPSVLPLNQDQALKTAVKVQLISFNTHYIINFRSLCIAQNDCDDLHLS